MSSRERSEYDALFDEVLTWDKQNEHLQGRLFGGKALEDAKIAAINQALSVYRERMPGIEQLLKNDPSLRKEPEYRAIETDMLFFRERYLPWVKNRIDRQKAEKQKELDAELNQLDAGYKGLDDVVTGYLKLFK